MFQACQSFKIVQKEKEEEKLNLENNNDDEKIIAARVKLFKDLGIKHEDKHYGESCEDLDSIEIATVNLLQRSTNGYDDSKEAINDYLDFFWNSKV